jgi:hypothetical protein
MDFETILEFARQHIGIGTIGLLFTWGGILWVYFRKRADWARKQFLTQVNFSLTYVRDGKMAMRTLMESTAQQVWLNDLGVKKVARAAAKTTRDQPFVELEDPVDMDFVYRAVLNVLSEKFAESYLAETLGLPVTAQEYLFTISFERYSDIRTLKLRVLLVSEKDLDEHFGPEGKVELPNDIYKARLKTMRAMHKLHKSAGQPAVMPLGRVVLGLRA